MTASYIVLSDLEDQVALQEDLTWLEIGMCQSSHLHSTCKLWTFSAHSTFDECFTDLWFHVIWCLTSFVTSLT